MNKESIELRDDYILELKSRGRSPGTIKQYVGDINKMYKWIDEVYGDVSILTLKRKNFRNYFLMLQEDEISNARINRFMSSIRNLLEYATEEDDTYPDYIQNPMKKIKSLEKIPTKEIVFLTNEQIEFLLDYLIKHNRIQHALYLSLSYDSACRRAEALQVEKHSFLDDDVFMTNKVKSKGNKQYHLMYSSYTRDLARQHLEGRTDDLDTLWITNRQDPRPVSSNTLYSWAISFREILKEEYGEDIPLNSHSIRHTSLQCYSDMTHRNLKNMGVEKLDLNMLKILANHSNVSTTEGYLKNTDLDKLNQLFGN